MPSRFGSLVNTSKIKVLIVSFICFSLLSFFAQASLLNPNDAGFGSGTRSSNYDELVDSFFSHPNVVGTIDNKLWVPWFSTSSSCLLGDLKSGNGCNSGQAIDFTHNCMVTDEFSQVGILVSMGKDQSRMDSFYNTVNSIPSTFGQIPAWRVYRDGNTITPCKSGINGNCDTASDATSRIIIALYTGANNQFFSNSAQKSAYLSLANQLASDMLTYEVDQTCRPSDIGLGDICYWMAAGSQVKKGGFASNDYAYSGYYADGIIAMLMACSQSGNSNYCSAAKGFAQNYLQAAKFNGNSFSVPPGRSFKWVVDANGVPQAQCSQICSPDHWDDADAPRALGMCQANYYAKQMGVTLPGMDAYCKLWGDKYATNTNSIVLQYNSDGSASGGSIGGYYYQGLQSLLESGYNSALFKPALDSALKHYNPKTKVWDNEACYGIYTKAFAIRALGFGIGRDSSVFRAVTDQPITSTCIPSPEICDGKDNNCNGLVDEGGVCNAPKSFIEGLKLTCTQNNQPCTIDSDVSSGSCRLVSAQFGALQVQACDKNDGFVEMYKKLAPDGLNFKICFGDGCVDKDTGFVRFKTAQCTPSPEICDGIDNNCNGLIDEGGACANATQPVDNSTASIEIPQQGANNANIPNPELIFEGPKPTEIVASPDITFMYELPKEASLNQTVHGWLFLENEQKETKATITQIVPEGASITDWSLNGVDNSSVKFSTNGTLVTWDFTTTQGNLGLDFSIKLPSSGYFARLMAVYISPSQMKNIEASIRILNPTKIAGFSTISPIYSPLETTDFIILVLMIALLTVVIAVQDYQHHEKSFY